MSLSKYINLTILFFKKRKNGSEISGKRGSGRMIFPRAAKITVSRGRSVCDFRENGGFLHLRTKNFPIDGQFARHERNVPAQTNFRQTDPGERLQNQRAKGGTK